MNAFSVWLFLIENPPLLMLAVAITACVMAAKA